MALETEESLKRTIENIKAKNTAEVEQLQHNLDKAKEEAREIEKRHHRESKLRITFSDSKIILIVDRNSGYR